MRSLGQLTLEGIRAETAFRYEQWLEPAKAWLKSRHKFALYYPSASIVRRVLQRTVELTFDPYSRVQFDSFKDGRLEAKDVPPLFFGGLQVDQRTGRLRPNLQLYARELFQGLGIFGFVGLQVFLSYLVSFFRVPRGPAALTTFLGHHIKAGGSDARFARFAAEGPVASLNSARRIIVQTGEKIVSTKPHRISYGSFPTFELIKDNRLGFISLLRIFGEHFVHCLRYLFLSFTRPELVLLGRDYAFLSVTQELDRKGLIEALFLTDGNSAAQYLYMVDLPGRNFLVHFIWHSQNVRGIVLDADRRQWEYPLRRYMKMDHAWCWTPEFARWIQNHGIAQRVHVVGPLMFHLPENPQKPGPLLRICLFDVTAASVDYIQKIGHGWDYYTAKTCTQFLVDIVAAVKEFTAKTGRSVQIVLKHKRSYAWVHDRNYIQKVSELQEAGAFEIVAPDCNIFDLVSNCDLVFSMPFTSAALAAKSQNAPAYFYDPTGHVWAPDDLHTSQVPLVRGNEELRQVLEQNLSRAMKSKSPPIPDHLSDNLGV